MKKIITAKYDKKVLSLISGVAFADVPAWYGCTRRSLKMDIIAPKERTGHALMPLIIWVCGGGYRCVNRSVWLPAMMYFAERGYVIASIEYRTVNDGTYEAAYADVKSAIRYLKAHAEHYCIDSNRIAIMGESGGGTMSSFAGATGKIRCFDQGDFLEYDSSVNAVVDIYGIVDFQHSPITPDGRDVPPFLVEDFLGLKYDDEIAKRASAITYIDEDTPPFFIMHGDKDRRVPIVQSEMMYDALNAAGVRADFLVLEGAGHGDDSFYQPEVLDAVDGFLKEVLN